MREHFPGADGVVYLNTASQALGAAPVRDAYQQALDAWVDGRFSFDDAERAGDDARALFARLIGADASEIALVPSVSGGAGTVAAQLGDARAGENVVVGAEEYTSNFFPWMLLRERGYEVRLVPFVNGAPPLDGFAEHIDARTRLVAASAVQSSSGVATDLAALAALAHARGAWLFVDACQAAGAVPLDVRALDVDFLATSSHKFLCGTRGMGYLYARRELAGSLRPIQAGWKAAREPMTSFFGPSMELSPNASRLDASLAWFAALGDRAALTMLHEAGPDMIYERNASLVRTLRGVLAERGVAAPSPDAPVGSTIVSFAVPDAARTVQRFAAADVIASARAGRVRVSLHAYNTPDELARVADLLAEA